MKEHRVNVIEERSTHGFPGRSDTVLLCSCGWEARVLHAHASSSAVETTLMYHRVVAIEEELGMKFELTFGRRKRDVRE